MQQASNTSQNLFIFHIEAEKILFRNFYDLPTFVGFFCMSCIQFLVLVWYLCVYVRVCMRVCVFFKVLPTAKVIWSLGPQLKVSSNRLEKPGSNRHPPDCKVSG